MNYSNIINILKESNIQRLCQVGAISLLLFLGACSKRYHEFPIFTPFEFAEHENNGVGRFKSSYLVEQMNEHYRGTNPGPIGVATFVNVDDLYTTSTFGRVYAEQVMSELSMNGFDVVELRHADALQFLGANGEFALSRDVGMVRKARDLGGVVVGTYAVSPVRVYVNARLLDPSTSVVMAAGSVEMQKSRELARLLRGGTFPGSLERIPVKHLGLSTYPMQQNPYQYQSQLWKAEESYLPQLNTPAEGLGVAPQFGTGAAE